MHTDASGKAKKQMVSQREIISETTVDDSNLKNMLREVIKEVLSEQGIITESSQKTKEQITFRVGQHVFECVITKIKKVK